MLQEITGRDSMQAGLSPPLHILLCPDQPSWAFDNIARNIERNAGDNRVSKLYMRDVIENESLLFETIFLKRIDVCHIFWREDLFHIFSPATMRKVAEKFGFSNEMIVRAINTCAFTTSVYDHLFVDFEDMRQRRIGFALADGYTVCSRKLQAIYSEHPHLPKPDVVITDGVDTQRFSPRPQEAQGKSQFTIGWVGNSAWGRKSQGYDVKGFERLFEPVMKSLLASGHNVVAKIADPQIKRIHFEDMPDFYRELDVFICTSSIEGTPNPVLEAMASGIPIVSTDVGIVPEAFGPLQSRFIIQDATVAKMAEAVAELLQNENLRARLGRENRERSMAWTWEIVTGPWWPFWRAAVHKAMDPRNALRREHSLRFILE